MNPTLTKYLPEKLQQHLSQLYLKNEADYWEQREILLLRYKGKWIAFDKGQVLMASENLDAVMDYVGSQRISAYITRVGQEVVISKLRRVAFDYDTTYQPPLPRATASFSNYHQTVSAAYPDAIPDTGADHSCLPYTDCEQILLFDSPFIPIQSRSLDNLDRFTLLFSGWVEIGRRTFKCKIEVLLNDVERIIGRDVLNQLTVTFKGIKKKVIFETRKWRLWNLL